MAGIMGLNTETNESNWRDLAVSELVVAVAHSFRVSFSAFLLAIINDILCSLVNSLSYLAWNWCHICDAYVWPIKILFWSSAGAFILLLPSVVSDSVTTRDGNYKILSGKSITKCTPILLARSKPQLSQPKLVVLWYHGCGDRRNLRKYLI